MPLDAIQLKIKTYSFLDYRSGRAVEDIKVS